MRSPDSEPLPTILGGLSLRLGGTLTYAASGWTYSPTGSLPAPLLFVSPNQINFQIPPGTPIGDIPAQITTPGTMLLSIIRIVPVQPAIFTLLQNGQGQGAVLNDDFSSNGDPQLFVGVKPTARGSVMKSTPPGPATPRHN